MDGRLFDLVTGISEHLDHNWTVTEMSAKVGLSLSQFRAVFTTLTLFTPGAYVKETRLLRAKHLLESTYDQIGQIGVGIGILDPSHLTRDFKARYGVTPTEYRRQYQEKRQTEILKGHKSAI